MRNSWIGFPPGISPRVTLPDSVRHPSGVGLGTVVGDGVIVLVAVGAGVGVLVAAGASAEQAERPRAANAAARYRGWLITGFLPGG